MLRKTRENPSQFVSVNSNNIFYNFYIEMAELRVKMALARQKVARRVYEKLSFAMKW